MGGSMVKAILFVVLIVLGLPLILFMALLSAFKHAGEHMRYLHEKET